MHIDRNNSIRKVITAARICTGGKAFLLRCVLKYKV